MIGITSAHGVVGCATTMPPPDLVAAHARTTAMTQQTAAIVASMHAEQKSAVALTSAELGRTQQQLAAKDTQLGSERQRRMALDHDLAARSGG